MIKYDWNFQEETYYYLTKDLESLYQIITSANHNIFLNFNINLTDSLTISGLSFKIFISKHYPKDVIPFC
jgi:hypothetical protein